MRFLPPVEPRGAEGGPGDFGCSTSPPNRWLKWACAVRSGFRVLGNGNPLESDGTWRPTTESQWPEPPLHRSRLRCFGAEVRKAALLHGLWADQSSSDEATPSSGLVGYWSCVARVAQEVGQSKSQMV